MSVMCARAAKDLDSDFRLFGPIKQKTNIKDNISYAILYENYTYKKFNINRLFSKFCDVTT